MQATSLPMPTRIQIRRAGLTGGLLGLAHRAVVLSFRHFVGLRQAEAQVQGTIPARDMIGVRGCSTQ